MSALHTPGPWQVLPEEVDRSYIRIRGTLLGGRYKIANVVTATYDGVGPREAEQTRANARLIAAAPDLLNALSVLAGAAESCGIPCDAARAAIAKATQP